MTATPSPRYFNAAFLTALADEVRSEYETWKRNHPGQGLVACEWPDALWTLEARLRGTARLIEQLRPLPTQLELDRALIRLIDERGEDLTPWELDFVESLTKWLDERGELTPKQRERAEFLAAEKAS